MSTSDKSLIGLRAQILGESPHHSHNMSISTDSTKDNFSYLNPLPHRPIIVTTYEEHGYEALIIENAPARRLLMHTHLPCESIEQALKEMLRELSRAVSEKVRPLRHPSLNLCSPRPKDEPVKEGVKVKQEAEAMDGSEWIESSKRDQVRY